MKSHMPASCPYRACKPSRDREREGLNRWRNRLSIFFCLHSNCFLLLHCVWFSSSFRMVKMLKLEIYSNQWVMLGCKRSSRSPTGTVRLGFWFGLGDPHNRSLNLKSRKENREKKIWPSILLIRLNDVRVRRVHLRKVGKLGWRRPFTKGTTATTWEK